MMPTILLRDGQLSFVTGARGGPRIISGTMLTILNWMRFGEGAKPRSTHRAFINSGCPTQSSSSPISRPMLQKISKLVATNSPKKPAGSAS